MQELSFHEGHADGRTACTWLFLHNKK